MRALLVIAPLVLAGCTTVKSNDGNLVTVSWDHSVSTKEEAAAVATQSCKEVGKQTATELSDVTTNPAMPAWMVTRAVTYQCR